MSYQPLPSSLSSLGLKKKVEYRAEVTLGLRSHLYIPSRHNTSAVPYVE